MRTRSIPRAGLGAVALSLAIPSAAAMAAAAQSDTTAASAAPEAAQPASRVAPRRAHIAIRSRHLHVRAGRRMVVTGKLRPGVRRARIQLQTRTARGWTRVARTRTDGRGRFRLVSRRAVSPLSAVARVRVLGGRRIRAAHKRVGRANVYRAALASWYGPGLYGNLLGCGGRLGVGSLGVAHKTLPCGTRVTLRHRGRSVRVAVIDRGPYVGNREYDLTSATARRLGFGGTGTILTTR